MIYKSSGSRIVAGDHQTDRPQQTGSFGPALMLGIAFSATIGGLGSLIGTPPNALLAAFAAKTYGISIGYGQWMLLGMPIVLVLLPVTWLLLTRVVFRLPSIAQPYEKAPPLEPMSRGQSIVAAFLVTTALAWIFRPLLSQWLGISGLTDAGIAMSAAMMLFVVPDRLTDGEPLINWDDVKTLRWDVLILLGGGLALADAIGSTGLGEWIGGTVAHFKGLPIILFVLILMATIVYLGELASNTAMAAVFVPIAGATAIGLGESPMTLVLPVALAASLGFMLPVATPPNAIVYGTGLVSTRQMLKAGALLDIISILIVFAFVMILGPIVIAMK